MARADVIAAIATPSGVGAIAVVRVSGPGAVGVLGSVLEGTVPEPRRASLRGLVDPDDGSLIDRAVVTLFPGPGSFTGEDLVEVGCHGGRLTPQLVLDALVRAGARVADPGEFTRRAYLNGRLDLLQAEAVADLIEADAPLTRTSALSRLDRGLSDRVEALRERLIHLVSLISYGIDFPDEDEPPVPEARILDAGREILDAIDGLLRTAPEGERLADGALVVLAGAPNVGKSALFNGLIGRERAIVTAVAGTTRDAIEAGIVVDGLPFRLVDTAGLRATDDPVEGIGIEVARRYLDDADMVLFCAEAGREIGVVERDFIARLSGAEVVRVATKSDAVASPAVAPDGWIPVSALDGTGLDAVRSALVENAFGRVGTDREVPLVTRRRHRRALERASAEVEEFLRAAEEGVGLDLAESHLREAIVALEGLIGVVTPDDMLDQLFSRFCVGK